MELTKEDFEILYNIEMVGLNDPDRLGTRIRGTKEEVENKFKDLERRGLLEIEYRKGKFYGAQLTEKGKEIYNDSKYEKGVQEIES